MEKGHLSEFALIKDGDHEGKAIPGGDFTRHYGVRFLCLFSSFKNSLGARLYVVVAKHFCLEDIRAWANDKVSFSSVQFFCFFFPIDRFGPTSSNHIENDSFFSLVGFEGRL